MIRVIISLLLVIGTLISCNEKVKNDDFDAVKFLEPSKVVNKEKAFGSLLKDTVMVGENAQVIVSLLDPKFDDKESQIIVFIEMEDSVLYKLEKDFNKLYELPVAGFYNFTVDTINKAPKYYKKQYSAYIGKSFQKTGYNKLRFMVMEFYGKDPTIDLDYNKSQVWFAILELDVFVIPKIDDE